MKIVVTGKGGYITEKIVKKLNENNQAISVSMFEENFEMNFPDNIDCIVHVAGLVPRKGVLARDYYDVNTIKTFKLLEYVKLKRIKKFIYISTMAVYGNLLDDEEYKPVNSKTECKPYNDYGKSKYIAEELVKNLSFYNIDWLILRLPSLYDENRMEYFYMYEKLISKTKILPKFIHTTNRSILHIGNLCELLYELVNTDISDKIILPQDSNIIDVNEILKVCSIRMNKKIKYSKLIGKLFLAISKKQSKFRNFTGSAYYDSEHSYKINKYSIYDIIK